MNLVTNGNNKTTDFVLRCAACGLYLADAASNFDVIAVTLKADKALVLTDGEAAEKARKFMKALYPSFEWRAVEKGMQAGTGAVLISQQFAA